MIKLLPALAAASALHVAVWVGFLHAADHGQASRPPVARPAMQARLHTVRVLAAAPAQAAPALLAAPPEAAAPAEPPPPAAATPPVPPAPAEADVPPPANTTPAAPAVADAATPDGEDTWWPRPKLTRPPVPSTMVELLYPPDVMLEGQHRVVLNLYIDEAGRVQRVQASDDSATLPAAYLSAARDAFLAARFAPGEINGAPVKSLIRMEVVFEQRFESAAIGRGLAGVR